MTEGQLAVPAHLVDATIDVFSTGVWGRSLYGGFTPACFPLHNGTYRLFSWLLSEEAAYLHLGEEHTCSWCLHF